MSQNNSEQRIAYMLQAGFAENICRKVVPRLAEISDGDFCANVNMLDSLNGHISNVMFHGHYSIPLNFLSVPYSVHKEQLEIPYELGFSDEQIRIYYQRISSWQYDRRLIQMVNEKLGSILPPDSLREFLINLFVNYVDLADMNELTDRIQIMLETIQPDQDENIRERFADILLTKYDDLFHKNSGITEFLQRLTEKRIHPADILDILHNHSDLLREFGSEYQGAPYYNTKDELIEDFCLAYSHPDMEYTLFATDHTYIRNMKNEDRQTLTDMCKDQQALDYLKIICPEEPVDALFRHAGLGHNPYLFSVVLKDTDTVIGFIERYLGHKSYKAGVVISGDYRNKGYGTEVIIALLDNMDYQHTRALETDDKNYLLDDGLIPFTVTAEFPAHDSKSKHFAQKVGFTESNMFGEHAVYEKELKFQNSR